MKKHFFFIAVFALSQAIPSIPLRLLAQEPSPTRIPVRSEPAGRMGPPKEEAIVTEHRLAINRTEIPYKATVGSILIRDHNGEPSALIYYTAYVRTDVKDLEHRAVSFLYNGGPGSSSIWLHMGAFGPRRVATADAAPTGVAPYEIVDNKYSLIDQSDLVFIDPVGTGFSHVVGTAKAKDFWGVDEDVASITQFITSYVSRNGRWNSPKFLIGESYGTFRSAALANYLQVHDGMYLNGIVLMSSVLDFSTIVFKPGENLAYILYLPSYAAAAYYYRLLNPEPPDLAAFLGQARQFAETKYAEALFEGSKLGQAEKSEIAQEMSRFTGLSEAYILQADLRVNMRQFTAELQRKQELTIGRLDARFSGAVEDPLAEYAPYDPNSTAVTGAFTAAWHDYLNSELRFKSARPYVVSASIPLDQWDWRHSNGPRYGYLGAPNVEPDLVQALVTNPYLQVEVENGYYDLGTPFFETEYTIDQLDLHGGVEKRIQMKYYGSGHMIYLHLPSLARLKTNLSAFIAAAEASKARGDASSR